MDVVVHVEFALFRRDVIELLAVVQVEDTDVIFLFEFHETGDHRLVVRAVIVASGVEKDRAVPDVAGIGDDVLHGAGGGRHVEVAVLADVAEGTVQRRVVRGELADEQVDVRVLVDVLNAVHIGAAALVRERRAADGFLGQFHAEALLEVLTEGVLQRRCAVSDGRAQDREVPALERVALEAFDPVKVVGLRVAGFPCHHAVVEPLPRLEAAHGTGEQEREQCQEDDDARQGDPEFLMRLFCFFHNGPSISVSAVSIPPVAMYAYSVFVSGVK